MIPPRLPINPQQFALKARLAQSVERETLNLKVAGSTPASGSIPDVVCLQTRPFLLLLRSSPPPVRKWTRLAKPFGYRRGRVRVEHSVSSR
ncbi:hypothetical protein BR93DRAFT_593413 [Coniochaeta sp. PMI_546]|nr:hypothetical protein BR93DRAFT_593413 [Coniochaeta sp. PMI_546]